MMEERIMDEMRMAKFETLISDINEAIKKDRFGGFRSIFRMTGSMSILAAGETNRTTPLYLIFEPEKTNDFVSVICKKAKFEISGNSDSYEDPWASKYGTQTLDDAKTKIEAAKDFVKYCRDEQNRPEAYKFIFWSLMIISVENENSDEWLSLICDFTRMLRISDDELMDIIYAIKCIYNEVEEEYVFKTETIPAVLGDLFNLYGNSDFTVE